MTLEEIMHPNPVCCRLGDTLDTVALKMQLEDIGAMPVIDRDRRVRGMITDRDICMAAAVRGQRLDRLSVHEAMTRAVYGVYADASVSDVERVMKRYQVRRVPVLDADGCAIGVVTLGDLARHCAQDYRARVSDREVAETLRAVLVPV